MKLVMIGLIGAFSLLDVSGLSAQSHPLDHFRKVIISPYIEATFVQGDNESINIESCSVDPSKLHIEVKKGILQVYLEGAKTIPREHRDNNGQSTDLYARRTVTATITYTALDALSLRGEETFVFKSPVSADDFDLRLFGEPAVTFPEVHFATMNTAIYGEGSVEIQSGSIDEQSFTCYGEAKVNTVSLQSKQAKLTAYGEAYFTVNVSERIKITSFGEAKLRYKGNPEIVKGLHFGDTALEKID